MEMQSILFYLLVIAILGNVLIRLKITLIKCTVWWDL
jgi:hypothetical protein